MDYRDDPSYPLYLDLPAAALRCLADDLEALARRYRARAATLDDWQASAHRVESRRQTIRATPKVLRHFLDAGMTDQEALATAAQATGIPAESIAYHARREAREAAQAATKARAMAVMRLAAQGHSNKAISQRLSLHPGSVSRIIRKQLAAQHR